MDGCPRGPGPLWPWEWPGGWHNAIFPAICIDGAGGSNAPALCLNDKGGGWRAGLVLPPIQPGAGILSELSRSVCACSGWVWGACSCLPRPAGASLALSALSPPPAAPALRCGGSSAGSVSLRGSVSGPLRGPSSGLSPTWPRASLAPQLAPLASPARASSRLRPLPGGVGRLVEPLQLARWRGALNRDPPNGEPPQDCGGADDPAPFAWLCFFVLVRRGQKSLFVRRSSRPFGLPSRFPVPELDMPGQTAGDARQRPQRRKTGTGV